MTKKNLAVFFGGQSTEHDISCMSVQNVVRHIKPEKYRVILVGITRDGHWIYVPSVNEIADDTWRNGKISAILSPDATKKCLCFFSGEKFQEVPVDVAFPVLHGPYGEDGTIQGLLELAKIPYVGCGVLASAASMDKLVTKQLVNPLGIRQAKYVPTDREAVRKDVTNVAHLVEEELPFPVFVKPSRAGSSFGVSKAKNHEELEQALMLAADHDSKILVEETIDGRELECAVLETEDGIRVAGPGEILAAAEFYDFDAKYRNEESRTDTAPVLPAGEGEAIRQAAAEIFRAVDGKGFARVDFFLPEDGFVFNEINTIPGFTAISMYPMLFEQTGMTKEELMDALISSAFLRETKKDQT